jgi:hypothetical protein
MKTPLIFTVNSKKRMVVLQMNTETGIKAGTIPEVLMYNHEILRLFF